MIVAIFGPSATGKTTLAELLSGRLGIPVRHCGVSLRAALGEDGPNAGDATHLRVDAETVEWCEQQAATDGIVEGRFLDSVLRASRGIVFVSVVATGDERAVRLGRRFGRQMSCADIAEIDKDDDLFRDRMYGPASAALAEFTIDTTGSVADKWVEKLEQYVRRRMGTEPG
jgi:cytidylate kinase